MEGWLSGRKHLTANEAVRNGTGVRISHLPLNITEAPARELRDEISEVLRNGTGKLTCKRADHWPIMMKDWRYCFKGWTSRNKYIAGREAMRDASVTVPAAPSVIDGLTAPKGLGTMEACCDVSQM